MALLRFIRRTRVKLVISFVFSVVFIATFLRKLTSDTREMTIDGRWEVLTKLSIVKTGPIFPKHAKVPITFASRFLIPNEAICSSVHNLTYVVVVHTAPKHFDRRESMRNTWANSRNNSRTVFLLGYTTNEVIQKAIKQESEQFGDIVQGSFIDDYKNLTLKGVMGLRWISQYCSNADFVVKVDDDVFVNMPQVKQNIFPLLAANRKELVCSVEPHAFIFRVGDPNKNLTKWLVSPDYFKGLENYPMPFCYGYAIFYTPSLAADLYKMAKSTPFFRLDDVFVYGILASKVTGLTWRNAGKTFYKTQDETLAAVSHRTKPLVLVGTADSASVMRTLWEVTRNKDV